MTDMEKMICAIEKAKRQSAEYAQDRIFVPFREADMIISLLREHEPVEPYDNPLGYYRCGNCGTHVHKYGEQDRCCPWCGRKVKWDATD